MKERDSRLAGLSVTGDLMSLVSSYVSEQRRSVPAVMSREGGARRLTFVHGNSVQSSHSARLVLSE